MNGFFLAIVQQGAGKTLLMTKLLVDEYRKSKRKVYSNYTLKNGINFTKVTLNPNRTHTKIPNILEMLDDNPDVFNDSIVMILSKLYFISLIKNNKMPLTF